MGTGASVNKNENIAMEQSLILATYKLLPEYTFCCSHRCYANAGEIPRSIPVPSPPPSRKSDIFDLGRYEAIDAKACEVDDKFMKQPIQKLVTFLTKDLEETLPKVRILFRWVTAQSLDQLSIQQNEPAHDSVQYQFWRIKNLKGNYAQLFSLLCSYAHIPCIIISGRLKGSSYSIGESVEDAKHYGEWNAVLIDGSWRLLNVFWGTCTEGPSDDNSEKKLVYCCDNNYFLTDPDQFIYTHFPDEDRWQLRDRPISQEEFTNQALLKDRFFDMNLKLNGPHECVVYHEKEVSFSFEMSEETQSNFWFLALLSSYDDGPRNDLKRYVFVERIDNHEMRIRVRNPGTGEYKLEIVGKDDTRIEENYSFDWIAIYKIIFNKSAVSPFPECPLIGWGPGNRSMFRCGLTSVSHNAGKIDTSTGSLEIKFERVNNLMPETSLIKLNYRGDLFKNGELYSMLNHVVHRVESNNFLFNVETPVSGEYAFKINALNEEGVITNICNYLIVSSQNKSNIPFPRDMHDRLGAKEAMKEMNIEIVTPKTAFIISDSKEEILFEFNKPSNVNLTAFVSCDDQHSFKPKIKQTFSEEKVIYKVKPGVSGNYGFRLRAVRGEGTLPQSVYDAVIKFSKLKKEKNIVPYEEKELKGLPEEIKTRIDKAMKHEDDNDLELIIEDIKLLTFSTKQEEIDKLEFDIQVIKCRKVLVSATMSKQILRMETALQRTCGKECVHRLEKEINALKAMLERTKKIARLLKDVMDLKQNVISEIKSYTKPPLIVHRVLIASLLLLGYNEDQTQNWSEVQKILSGTVRASIIRKVSKFDMDKISPDVAQKAKGYISDITLDDVRLISAGAATFYVWIKGVTEEIEKRRSEGQQSIAEFAENKNNVNGRSERNDNDQSDRDGRIETLYDVQSEHDEIEANDSKGGEFEDNLNFNGQNGTNDMENPEEQGNSNCNGKNDIDFDESEIIFENLDFKDLSVEDENGHMGYQINK